MHGSKARTRSWAAAGLAATLTLAGALGGCAALGLGQPLRLQERTGGSDAGAQLNNYGQAVIPKGGRVAVVGDDYVYGADPHGHRAPINGAAPRRSPTPFPETLRKRLGKGVTVENRGYPGDTLARGTVRWFNAPRADLVILCYGWGDFKAGTPPMQFAAQLQAAIRAYRAQGTAVFLLTTPGQSDPAVNGSVDAYRTAMRQIGPREGAAVFEGWRASNATATPWTAGGWQAPLVYQAMAGMIAPYIHTTD